MILDSINPENQDIFQRIHFKLFEAAIDRQVSVQINKQKKTTPNQWLDKKLKKDSIVRRPNFNKNTLGINLTQFYQKAISEMKYQSQFIQLQTNLNNTNSLILKTIHQSLKNKTLRLNQLSRSQMMLIESVVKPGQQRFNYYKTPKDCSIEKMRQIRSVKQYLFQLQLSALERNQQTKRKERFLKYWVHKVQLMQLENKQKSMKVSRHNNRRIKQDNIKFRQSIQTTQTQNNAFEDKILNLKKIYKDKYLDLQKLKAKTRMMEMEFSNGQKIQTQITDLAITSLSFDYQQNKSVNDLSLQLKKIKSHHYNQQKINNLEQLKSQILVIQDKRNNLEKQTNELKIQRQNSKFSSSVKNPNQIDDLNISQRLKHKMELLSRKKDLYQKVICQAEQFQTTILTEIEKYFVEWQNKTRQIKFAIKNTYQRREEISKTKEQIQSLKQAYLVREKQIQKVWQNDEWTEQQYLVDDD